MQQKKNVQDRGEYKGFSNEGVNDLFKMEGPSGPLDYSGNEQKMRDVHHHKLGKISNKIDDNLNNLQNKQRTI